MDHPTEQDLLLFAHRSIGLGKAAALWLHLKRCPDCRKRYAGICSMTASLAHAMRPGMPAWKPIETALRMQILVAAFVIGVGVFSAQQLFLTPKAPPPATAAEIAAASANNRACETEETPAPKDKKVKRTGSRLKPRPKKGTGAPSPGVE